MSEDLYGYLDLQKGASESEIKRAYRQVARKYHPDVNKDPGADQKFKNAQKAYDILSDSQKRARYDQYGITDDSPGGSGFGGGAGFEGFSDQFEDIFDVFFGGQRRGGGGGRGRSAARQGEDLRYDLELTLEEVSTGVTKSIDIFHMEGCSRCEGSGAQPGTSKTTCSQCQGMGQVKSVQQTLLGSFSQVMTCPACQGEGEIIEKPCLVCHGHGIEKQKKSIEVDIPAGVDKGTKLRVTGEGNAGERGGATGDLYIFVSVKEHSYFRRDNANVYLEVTLPLTKVILGTEIEVPILEGKAKLKIPSGTQPGTLFKLKGKGVPYFRGYGRGDQFVKVDVDVPKKLSKQEMKLMEELATLRGEDKAPSTFLDYVKQH